VKKGKIAREDSTFDGAGRRGEKGKKFICNGGDAEVGIEGNHQDLLFC